MPVTFDDLMLSFKGGGRILAHVCCLTQLHFLEDVPAPTPFNFKLTNMASKYMF